MRGALMPKDERNFYSGHAADDVAATYGENLPATLNAYIKRIPHPAPRAVELTAQRQKSGRAISCPAS
jgi:hypothetical protein